MDKVLHALMDYQRFYNLPELESLILKIGQKYLREADFEARELMDEELNISAAGDTKRQDRNGLPL